MEHPEDALPADFADALLDRREASAYLASIGVRRTPKTLAKIYSAREDGPPCVHHGRRPLYPKRKLHEWAMRQLTLQHSRARPTQPTPSQGDLRA
ncbi:MAG: hypothetical protein JNJ63_11100 [Hyphomonadaceae bacterium]|nr:hypothetical protein [Hyphomonadaceae bacterium]